MNGAKTIQMGFKEIPNSCGTTSKNQSLIRGKPSILVKLVCFIPCSFSWVVVQPWKTKIIMAFPLCFPLKEFFPPKRISRIRFFRSNVFQASELELLVVQGYCFPITRGWSSTSWLSFKYSLKRFPVKRWGDCSLSHDF